MFRQKNCMEMNESGVEYNSKNIALTSGKEDDARGNLSQTEGPRAEGVHKRPRGRPKLAKSLTKLSIKKRQGLHRGYFSLPESGGKSTNGEKRSRGRPKLSKSRTELPKILRFKHKTEMITGNSADLKRGRGRPKGSLNTSAKKIKLDENHSDDRDLIATTDRSESPPTISTSKTKHVENRSEGVDPDTSISRKENQATNNTESLPSTSRMTTQKHYTVTITPKSMLNPNAKRCRGRPPGSKNKPKTTVMVPVSMSKRSKTQYVGMQKANSRQKNNEQPTKTYQPAYVRDIPKHRFDEALTMLTDPEHPIWEERNTSCSKSIHRHWDEYVAALSDHNLRLKFARQFLVRRDWINLSKVLSISLQDVVTSCNSYYSLFTKVS